MNIEYWVNNEYFLQLSQYVGEFGAVSSIGAQARAVAKLYNGVISHAEALSWIVTGKAPKGLLNRETESERRDKRITLWVNDIYDEDVRSSVLASIYASLRVHNLTYIYNNTLIESKYSRVRILTKLLWDYIH